MITGIGTGNGVGLIRGLFPSTASAFENSKSVYFDGVNDYISLTPPAALQLDFNVNVYSISFWIKWVSGNVTAAFLGNSPNSVTRGWQIGKVGSAVYFACSFGGGNRIIWQSTATAAFDGGWHHIAFTMGTAGSGASCQLYLDGAPMTNSYVIDALTATTSTAADIEAGKGPTAGTYEEMYIDELAIFDSGLSAADVLAIYNSGCPADLSSYSPISWWRFEDDYTDEEGVQDFTATGASISSDIPC